MYGQRPQMQGEEVENGTGGFSNGAPGWWREGGGYMNVVAAMPHHPPHTYPHEQGFDPQTCINLKGFEFSDLDHALLGEEPATRSHAARLHQLGSQQHPGHGHPVQVFHQDAYRGEIVHGELPAKFAAFQREDYSQTQQFQGGERPQLYRNGSSVEYSQFVGMHPNVAVKHHPRGGMYQGVTDMSGQFVRVSEDDVAARTQPTDHWQHRSFPGQSLPTQPVHSPLHTNATMDSFEKMAQTDLRMRMMCAQQGVVMQQRGMMSPAHANTPSPALQKPCAAAGTLPWQPAPLVSRSSSISSTHSNLSGASGQCFSPCMQTPTPVPQSPCGTVPRSPCQPHPPPHRSPNLSSVRAVHEEGARWPCEQPTQIMQAVIQRDPTDTATPLMERQAWELQHREPVVLSTTEREPCPDWPSNFPTSAEPQHNVLPNHLQAEENVFTSQEGLQVGYGSLPKVEREVEIPRLQMASPPVPYQMDMNRLEAKDQTFQRQIQIVQNTHVEGRGYAYQQEQPVPESPSYTARHAEHFYPGFTTQSGLSVPAVSVNNTADPKEVLPQELVAPLSQEQRLSHPAVSLTAEHKSEHLETKPNAGTNFMWPSDDTPKGEQALSNGSQVPSSVVNNLREAVRDVPVDATRPRTQNVLAALSTACHNLISNLQRSTYNLYDTVGKEERAQASLEHAGIMWESNGHVSQEMWKGEVDEVQVPPLPSVDSSDELPTVVSMFNHTEDAALQRNCSGGLSTSIENEAAPTRKRRSSDDSFQMNGKKLKSELKDVEQKQEGNMVTELSDREKNNFNSTFPTQDGKQTTSVQLSNKAGTESTFHSFADSATSTSGALQNTGTSLHLTIVNGNVYPASAPGTSLQPAPIEPPQDRNALKETANSSETNVGDRTLPNEAESFIAQGVAPLYTQQSSTETCQSKPGENRTENEGRAPGFTQDEQCAQPPENSAVVTQEDRGGGSGAGEDRHPLEILQAQIRLQQQQFNLAPADALSARPSSAPCTTDSKEALLEDSWYQPSSPSQDDGSKAPWEKNREKIVKMEELEPGSVDRRLLHKLNEQRRRDSLKSAIYCLKQAIPDCRDSSDQSQQNVLNKANNFILEMLDKQRQADQCREEVSVLRARNVALQQGIAALQREYNHLRKTDEKRHCETALFPMQQAPIRAYSKGAGTTTEVSAKSTVEYKLEFRKPNMQYRW